MNIYKGIGCKKEFTSFNGHSKHHGKCNEKYNASSAMLLLAS